MDKPKQRAAQYLRMSTDQQRYSTENQSAAIQIYAEIRGFEIVATYIDEGKSGLHIGGRTGLQSLIRDVQAGTCDFSAIIVYDVSRWGRFQDADESAYYEFICRRAGIAVEYCAEQFENDGSPLSTIVKSIKRAMAAEYSRELSTKVFLGQQRLIKKGFLLGGVSCYGFRRQIIDPSGTPKVVLTYGQWKNIREDRIVLVLGPQEEVDNVRWMYREYIGGATETEIAKALINHGVRSDNGKPFTRKLVHSVLTSERYVGTNVWNRTSAKLKGRRLHNRPEAWVRFPNAFPALIDVEIFKAAEDERRKRSRRLSDEEMLAPLRKLLSARGRLTIALIDGTKNLMPHTAYTFRFGSMRRVYQLLGYKTTDNIGHTETRARFKEPLAAVHNYLGPALVAAAFDVQMLPHNKILVEKSCSVLVVAARYRKCEHHGLGWQVLPTRQTADIYVVARPDRANQSVIDYFILPRLLLTVLHFNLTEHKVKALYLDYHSPNLAGIAEKVEMVRNEISRKIQYDLSGRGGTVKVVLDVFPPNRTPLERL